MLANSSARRSVFDRAPPNVAEVSDHPKVRVREKHQSPFREWEDEDDPLPLLALANGFLHPGRRALEWRVDVARAPPLGREPVVTVRQRERIELEFRFELPHELGRREPVMLAVGVSLIRHYAALTTHHRAEREPNAARTPPERSRTRLVARGRRR